MLTPPAVLTSLGVTVVLAAGGASGAWWLRRHSTLSIRNVYPVAANSLLLLLAAVIDSYSTCAGQGRWWRIWLCGPIHRRPWPAHVEYESMTAAGHRRPRR